MSELGVLEAYYDTVPRSLATVHDVGPFTLFVQQDADGWPFYARPTLGATGVTPRDVERVLAHQRRLGVPEALEWVHQTTPDLLPAARTVGMRVEKCPLLVLRRLGAPTPAGVTTRVLQVDDDLEPVLGVVAAAFGGSDEVHPHPGGPRRAMMAAGLLRLVAAYDDDGTVIGGGSHSPRGVTTELTGIAVLPRARGRGVGAALTTALVVDARARGTTTCFLSAQDDAVARVYARVGFGRVGTACIAGAGP